MVGVFPFGMIYGVSATQAGIPANLTQAMSSVLFAGSAQFATAVLIGQITPFLVILLTIVVLNIRHIFYSASLAPYTRDLPLLWKLGLSYLLTDEAYAVTVMHYEDESVANTHKHWFFLGAGLTLWTCWQISTGVGIFLGMQVPSSWSLDFTLALVFIAFLFSSIKDRNGAFAALAAGVCATGFAFLPNKLGLVIATIVGVAVGLLMERRK